MNADRIQDLFVRLQERRTNPHAFEQWREYRDFLTSVIIQGSRDDMDIGIFGAGRCNDLDLHRLSEYFHSVTLIDRDLIAMREACVRYGIPEYGNVRVCLCDFVGLSQQDYVQFAKKCFMLIEKFGPDPYSVKLIEGVVAYLSCLYRKATGSADFCEQYGSVVSAGVHSQLDEMPAHIWEESMRFFGVEIDPLSDPVTSRIHRETLRLVLSYDDLLFSSAIK